MYELKITLCSDSAFSRGDATPGIVDSEIDHHPETGLPFVRGSVLKGLLVEECANILFALNEMKHPQLALLDKAAADLFGQPGSDDESEAQISIGQGNLPDQFAQSVLTSVRLKSNPISASDVFNSLTSIRYQTAINEKLGSAEEGSLRAIRVALRKLEFTAPVMMRKGLDDEQKGLLAAAVLATRRGGLARNRGLGRLDLRIMDDGNDVTHTWVGLLENILGEEVTQ